MTTSEGPESSIATAFAGLCAPLGRIKRSDFAVRSTWAKDAGAALLDGWLRAEVPCAMSITDAAQSRDDAKTRNALDKHGTPSSPSLAY
jgi:hypothetical protein